VKAHKLYIIKKLSNNKFSFVKFIFNSRQFRLVTAGSQPHGARWPRFNCVQMIETMSWAAAVAKKMISLISVSEGLLVITVVILILVCVNIVQTLASQMLLWI